MGRMNAEHSRLSNMSQKKIKALRKKFISWQGDDMENRRVKRNWRQFKRMSEKSVSK